MYGIICRNNDGHVLISSEIAGLHYAGDATYFGQVAHLAPTKNFNYNSMSGGDIVTDGHFIFRYTFVTTGIPIVFIKGSVGTFFAVLTHKQNGTTWTFDVIQGGSSPMPPRLLIFTTVDHISRSTTSSYGIATYLPSGKKAFDSRLGPLGILGGGLSAPPQYPPVSGPTPDSWRYVDMGEGQDPWPPLDWNFRCSGNYSTTQINPNLNINNLMFSAPSLAQSCWIRKIHHHWYDEEYDGNQQHDVYRSWWVFYRSAFRLRFNGAQNCFDAGWVPYACGYSEIRDYEDSLFGGSGGYFNSGTPPFTQKTINLFQNAFMVGDATNY